MGQGQPRQNVASAGAHFSLIPLPDQERELKPRIGLTCRQGGWDFAPVSLGQWCPRVVLVGTHDLQGPEEPDLSDAQSLCSSAAAKRKLKGFHCSGRTSELPLTMAVRH